MTDQPTNQSRLVRPQPPPPDPRSDEALVASINDGDSSAFEVLYRRHQQFVLRVASRYLTEPTDALDVLQNVFMYVLGKFPGFRLTARFTTFLYPVIRHESLARRRRRIGFSGPDPDELSLAGPRPPPSASGSLQDLASLLTVLPDAQRECILMRFVDDLSLQEIAAVLDVPLGTVKSRLHHAIATLRQDPRTRAYFDVPDGV